VCKSTARTECFTTTITDDTSRCKKDCSLRKRVGTRNGRSAELELAVRPGASAGDQVEQELGVALLVARAALQALHGHLGDAVVVHERRRHHQQVEDLVRLELQGRKGHNHTPPKSHPTRTTTHPDVALAREEALGHAEGVEQRAADVEQRHQRHPAHRRLVDGRVEAVHDEVVAARDHRRQPQAHEQPCDQRLIHTTQALRSFSINHKFDIYSYYRR